MVTLSLAIPVLNFDSGLSVQKHLVLKAMRLLLHCLLQLPRPLVSLVSKIFGPLLSDTRPGPLVILPGGSRAGAGLGAAAAAGGGQQRPGRGAGPSQVRGGICW